MYEDSIYSDNLQRTLVVGLIQERINYLEDRNARISYESSTDFKMNVDEIKSLKDFLLFHS